MDLTLTWVWKVLREIYEERLSGGSAPGWPRFFKNPIKINADPG